MRLLLAEDDLDLGQATCRGLMQLGYAVDWLTSGQRVSAAMTAYPYDCVLLDLGLPDVSGESCLQAMMRGRAGVPVIVLTAREAKDDKVHMLDLGADDYLSKPYDLDELAARVRAVVRRAARSEPSTESLPLEHGTLRIQPSTQGVWLDGEPKTLTTKEFWLLETLMRHRERIVTRQTLVEALYGWADDLASNAIEVYVHNLRRKLGSATIRTVRGVGYQLGAPSRV